MKKYPRYFNNEKDRLLFNSIPKRVWAAIAKDYVIFNIGEDTYLEDSDAWAKELKSRIRILKKNELT